jgi:hypothetical protein
MRLQNLHRIRVVIVQRKARERHVAGLAQIFNHRIKFAQCLQDVGSGYLRLGRDRKLIGGEFLNLTIGPGFALSVLIRRASPATNFVGHESHAKINLPCFQVDESPRLPLVGHEVAIHFGDL